MLFIVVSSGITSRVAGSENPTVNTRQIALSDDCAKAAENHYPRLRGYL
jgi:hypothetical protein